MPIATGTRERPGRVRVWAHRVLGALGWVALVLLAVWRLPEVARTVACSIVVDDRRGDIERMGAADTLMILADHRSVPALRQGYSTSKWPGLRIRVLGALKRSGDPEIDRRLAAIAEHETNQAVRQWALDQRVR